MKVVAIMTCFNRKEKTVNCISSLIRGNPSIEFEFIVVDDKSKDGTRDALTRTFDNVNIIEGTGSLYYSGGMRIGIEYVKSVNPTDYVLLINDDVEFAHNSIERLVKLSIDNDCIVVGATEDGDGNITYGGVLKKSKYKPSFLITMSHNKLQFCDTFNANCVLIPYGVFLQIPNIDRKYIHSLGDFDYGLRATQMGYKIVASDFFVGICKTNSFINTWMDKSMPKKERLKKKESAKGQPFGPWFHFIRKNYNIISAIACTMNDYLKILIS